MPTIEDLEQFVVSFHELHPGSTARSFADAKGSDGRSSYDSLASVVRIQPGRRIRVLEIACGNGLLLGKLFRTHPQGLDLVGVDASAAELQAARARLPSPSVLLKQCRLPKLPFEDASFDYVLCHLSFEMMLPIEPVVAEIARVLRFGGVFSAVVDAPWPPTASAQLVGQVLGQAFQEYDGNVNFVDPRTTSFHGLKTILQPAGFNVTEEHTHTLSRDIRGSDFWTFLLETYYTISLLPKEKQATVHQQLIEKMNLAVRNRLIPWTFCLRQFLAVRVPFTPLGETP